MKKMHVAPPKDGAPARLWWSPSLDGEDRRALAQLGGYALLVGFSMAGLLLLTLVLALCVRIFMAVSGVGV